MIRIESSFSFTRSAPLPALKGIETFTTLGVVSPLKKSRSAPLPALKGIETFTTLGVVSPLKKSRSAPLPGLKGIETDCANAVTAEASATAGHGIDIPGGVPAMTLAQSSQSGGRRVSQGRARS